MERTEIIKLIREAIDFADSYKSFPYTEEQFDAMHDLLDEIENKPTKRSSDDWRGCQGTCDFDDPGFNTTGWI